MVDHVLFAVSSVRVSIQFILGSITENYHGLDTQHRHTGSQLIIANTLRPAEYEALAAASREGK